jgi:hypothetical protein
MGYDNKCISSALILPNRDAMERLVALLSNGLMRGSELAKRFRGRPRENSVYS